RRIQANVPARSGGRALQRRRDRRARALLFRERHTVLEVEDRDIEIARGKLPESERAVKHARAMARDEHERSEQHRGPRAHQYERGMPRTFCPMYASTRLLLTGATSSRRVSRNLRSTSYSAANPYPPCVSSAAFAASHDACDASSFAMLASAPHGLPRSKSHAALSRSSVAASRCACACATGNWTPWFAPIGLPKTTRSPAYRAAR